MTKPFLTLLCVLSLSLYGRCAEESGAGAGRNPVGMKGVNLANALEAPSEGQWGVVLREEYFDAIAGAGFTLIRVPVAFSAHADATAPFAVSEPFLTRVDEVLRWAADRRLAIVLSFHSYEELYRDPEPHGERFVAIWEQVAERFAGRYPDCYFELLNEPHGNLTAAVWNDLLAEAVERVGRVDPERALVLGGVDYSDIRSLDQLVLPDEKKNLVATFHYYRPYQFTHQGAEWAEESDKWIGMRWPENDAEIEAVSKDFDEAARWSEKTGIPLFLGEFGCIAKADPASRARWTAAVRREAEARSFGWACWDFCAAFGIYDTGKSEFDREMLDALMSR